MILSVGFSSVRGCIAVVGWNSSEVAGVKDCVMVVGCSSLEVVLVIVEERKCSPSDKVSVIAIPVTSLLLPLPKVI